MKPPKTPIEFDYDLWKTEDGICMVRVKLTGEECSVDEQTFRLLRNEEKRLRRSKGGITAQEHPSERNALLSTDYISLDSSDDDMQASWLIDPVNMEDSIATQVDTDAFTKTLTPYQQDIFEKCLLGTMSFAEYAVSHGVRYQAIQNIATKLQEKAKKFFD